jgi:hypothetical protein
MFVMILEMVDELVPCIFSEGNCILFKNSFLTHLLWLVDCHNITCILIKFK